VKRIKVNKLRWAGHVIMRPVEAPVNKVFKCGFVDGKRSRGRPNNSWKEAVDRDSIAQFQATSKKGHGSQLICTASEVSK